MLVDCTCLACSNGIDPHGLLPRYYGKNTVIFCFLEMLLLFIHEFLWLILFVPNQEDFSFFPCDLCRFSGKIRFADHLFG